MKNEDRIAAEIFRQYGLDFETAIRAETGWTNAVWLNGGLVLRVSLSKDTDRIIREVELSKLLPAEVGYPENVATGKTDGYEWSLSKRIQGQTLSKVWSSLSWKEKSHAIKQIIDIANHVHSVDISKLESLAGKTAWYNKFSEEDTMARIEYYTERKILTVEQGNQMRKIINRFYEKHFTMKPVLNHGDITLDNIMWNQGNVVSLMDFECAVTAPPELDLRALVNLTLLAEDDRILTRSDSNEIREYIDAVSGMLKPMLVRSESVDLILGYSILFWQRFFDGWLGENEWDIKNADGAYIKMCSLLGENKGYLSAFL